MLDEEYTPWQKQFPKEIDIVLYCEEQQPLDVDARIKCVDLNTAEPELFNFKNKYKNDPVANGKMEQINGGVRRSPKLQGLDKAKESFPLGRCKIFKQSFFA